MIIILPNQMDGLAQLESTLLSSNLLNTLDDELYRAPCAVTVPKFTIDSSLDLKSVLKRLGVHDLFDSAVADLSGIDGSRMLYVSDAFQRAFIRVNEEGTKAASATGNLMCDYFFPNLHFKFFNVFFFQRWWYLLEMREQADQASIANSGLIIHLFSLLEMT